MDVEHQRMVATEPPTDLHRGLARQSGPEAHVASPDSCKSMLLVGFCLHTGLPCAREVGLAAEKHANLGVAKDQTKRYSGCLVAVSLDRNPAAQRTTGFGVHGVLNALRTGNDLIWLLQYDGSSDRFALSRCLHPMERCALQRFRPEQLGGVSKSGNMRATGNAMSAPSGGRCFQALRGGLGLPLGHACPARHTAEGR